MESIEQLHQLPGAIFAVAILAVAGRCSVNLAAIVAGLPVPFGGAGKKKKGG